MQIHHHSRELRDLVLLQIPDTHLLQATVHLAKQTRIETELFPTAVLHFKWPVDTGVDVKSILRRTADAYTKANSLAYKMVTSSTKISALGAHENSKSTTITLTHASRVRTSENGEPIPSSLPYASIHVADDVYSIITDNGVDFSVLKNGEEVAGRLPSEGFALGTMFKYILPELATKGDAAGSKTAEQELTKDFVYSVGTILLEGGELDDSARRYLVDFVEMFTNRDFGTEKGE